MIIQRLFSTKPITKQSINKFLGNIRNPEQLLNDFVTLHKQILKSHKTVPEFYFQEVSNWLQVNYIAPEVAIQIKRFVKGSYGSTPLRLQVDIYSKQSPQTTQGSNKLLAQLLTYKQSVSSESIQLCLYLKAVNQSTQATDLLSLVKLSQPALNLLIKKKEIFLIKSIQKIKQDFGRTQENKTTPPPQLQKQLNSNIQQKLNEFYQLSIPVFSGYAAIGRVANRVGKIHFALPYLNHAQNLYLETMIHLNKQFLQQQFVRLLGQLISIYVKLKNEQAISNVALTLLEILQQRFSTENQQNFELKFPAFLYVFNILNKFGKGRAKTFGQHGLRFMQKHFMSRDQQKLKLVRKALEQSKLK